MADTSAERDANGYPSAGGGPLDLLAQLPPGLAALFRPGVERLTTEIFAEVAEYVPELSRHRAFGETVVAAVQQAVVRFVDRLADPATPWDDLADVFRELGTHAIRVDELQAAYRIGARVAWRHMAETGGRAGVPTASLCLLAEAIFAYVDELSAFAVEGHRTGPGDTETLRRDRAHLLAAILTPGTAPTARLAGAAHWPVPERVAAVALEPGPAPTAALDPRLLADLDGAEPCILVGEPDRALLNSLAAALPGWRAGVGPLVPLADAGDSLRWARHTLALVRRGVLPDSPVTRFEEHLSTLWLLIDPPLAAALFEHALAPLAKVGHVQRAKLTETLLTWWETRRSAPEAADRLGVHPQTVRYRLRQLDALFDGLIDDPDCRFGIEVALRARNATELTDH